MCVCVYRFRIHNPHWKCFVNVAWDHIRAMNGLRWLWTDSNIDFNITRPAPLLHMDMWMHMNVVSLCLMWEMWRKWANRTHRLNLFRRNCQSEVYATNGIISHIAHSIIRRIYTTGFLHQNTFPVTLEHFQPSLTISWETHTHNTVYYPPFPSVQQLVSHTDGYVINIRLMSVGNMWKTFGFLLSHGLHFIVRCGLKQTLIWPLIEGKASHVVIALRTPNYCCCWSC